MPHIERLEKTLEILKATPEGEFDIKSWDCGTTACVVGNAARDPWHQEQGLVPRKFQGITLPTFMVEGEELRSWDATEVFYEISNPQAHELFAVHHDTLGRRIHETKAERVAMLEAFINKHRD